MWMRPSTNYYELIRGGHELRGNHNSSCQLPPDVTQLPQDVTQLPQDVTQVPWTKVPRVHRKPPGPGPGPPGRLSNSTAARPRAGGLAVYPWYPWYLGPWYLGNVLWQLGNVLWQLGNVLWQLGTVLWQPGRTPGSVAACGSGCHIEFYHSGEVAATS